MAGHTFRDVELAGWDRKAGHWDDTLGPVTREAIAPLLDAVEAASGVRLLDIACGSGALAAAAAGRGAEVVGMDFAPAMVAEAARRHPGVEFRVADAEAIPLADASVDAVTCSFGLLHMERPERVLAEVARVLRPGIGRFAMTAWVPEGDFFALVGQAVPGPRRHDSVVAARPADVPLRRRGRVPVRPARGGFRRKRLPAAAARLDRRHTGVSPRPSPPRHGARADAD
jgi:SAM-dependent methyltransferase